MRRIPPGPVLRSLVLTALVVWVVPRGALGGGVQLVSRTMEVQPRISPMIYLILAAAVAFVVYLDVVSSHERVFLANLGVSRGTILAIAFGTALLAEIMLAVIPLVVSVLLAG